MHSWKKLRIAIAVALAAFIKVLCRWLVRKKEEIKVATSARLPSLGDPVPSPSPFSILPAYGDELQESHAIWGSQPWRLAHYGIGVPRADDSPLERSLVDRTYGEPTTVTRIMQKFRTSIKEWGGVYGVPVELIVACIATESRGMTRAYREEPGYTDEVKTPHRVSAGLMQTLVSTARDTLMAIEGIPAASPVCSDWLFDPDNSMRAGAAYIAMQKAKTQFDPPKVAAAYNAGGVIKDMAGSNPWKMRCYPAGTGRHITKFVQFYNDTVWVLNQNGGEFPTVNAQ